jgi:hypothetical protein
MATTPEQRAKKAAYMREYYQRDGTKERRRAYYTSDEVKAHRRKTRPAYYRKWYAANKERARSRASELTRKWRAENPEKVREQLRRKKYGIGNSEIERMWRHAGGCCEHCFEPKEHPLASELTNPARLQIDHDHETGEIRGLLCIVCNTKEIAFWDRLRREVGQLPPHAPKYMRDHYGAVPFRF